MFLTLLSGILAIHARARAEETQGNADAGAPGELSPIAPLGADGGALAPAPAIDADAPSAPEVGTGVAPIAAPAVTPAPAEATAVKTDESPGDKKKKKRKRKDQGDAAPEIRDHPSWGNLAIKGRVYARGELDHRRATILDQTFTPRDTTIDSFDISVPIARLSLHYRAPMEWLTAMAELDFSGQPDMRDGYVQARNSHFTARAGQFKVPVSPLAAASPWSLPWVRRGFLHDVLVDRLDYGGRRPGVMFGWRDKGGVHPRVSVSAFQGSIMTRDPTPFERRTDLLEARLLASQSLVARAEIEILGADVGVYFEDRIGSPATLRTDRYWTAGADIVVDHVFANGGLRLWVDAIAGASWYEHASKPADNKDAIFLTGRTLVAYRFGGTVDDAFYVEPYAMAGAFDPDTEVVADWAFEGAVGVGVGLWRRARLWLQGEINEALRNFPEGYFVGRPPKRVGVILQAGVAF